jgi:predicted DNA-binding transcriptional regulator YafY
MYNKFLDGNSYSSAEMYDEILKVFKVNLSLRTVQRDLRTLHEMAPNMEQINVGRQVYWRLSKNALNPKYMKDVDSSDFYNFYFMKSFLKQYVTSSFGKEAEKLIKRLENIAPGNAFLEDARQWINEHGTVNYKNYSNVFEEIVEGIIEKKWLNVTYTELYSSEIHHQFAMFKGFFAFRGSIFLIAFVPRKHGYLTIPLENIGKTAPAQPYNEYVPEFNSKVFFENRFGISDGELIVLILKFEGEDAKVYGTRQWHPKQVVTTDPDGSVTIRFNVILNRELISWLLGMGNVCKVLSPVEVIDRIKEESRRTLALYE